MMNELVKITNEIQSCDKANVSKSIMGVCRAVTPQFYKNMSVDDIKAERLSIELLTADIDNETLSEMCKRAVLNYPKARSESNKTYFDINYILTFYKKTFNDIHCNNIKLSKNATKVWDRFDDKKNILYQKWLDNGQEINIAVILEENEIRGHLYSPKDFEIMYSNLDDVEI